MSWGLGSRDSKLKLAGCMLSSCGKKPVLRSADAHCCLCCFLATPCNPLELAWAPICCEVLSLISLLTLPTHPQDSKRSLLYSLRSWNWHSWSACYWLSSPMASKFSAASPSCPAFSPLSFFVPTTLSTPFPMPLGGKGCLNMGPQRHPLPHTWLHIHQTYSFCLIFFLNKHNSHSFLQVPIYWWCSLRVSTWWRKRRDQMFLSLFLTTAW